jgi:hypothetical protein
MTRIPRTALSVLRAAPAWIADLRHVDLSPQPPEDALDAARPIHRRTP